MSDFLDPDRKAMQLIDTYYKLVEFDLDTDKQIGRAKSCALIAVDEILRVMGSYGSPYWSEVRKQIQQFKRGNAPIPPRPTPRTYTDGLGPGEWEK
jgi:hypothetical protein